MDTKNIIIVGVGGQGSLLASKLMGRVLLIEGYDAKVSEVHGMSQRGGAVITYVRYGEKVYSPIVDEGQAQLLVAFEILEAARWLKLLSPGGQVVTNTQQIDPTSVTTGAMEYPLDLVSKFEKAGIKVDAIDALALAVKAGSAKSVNIVMMGRLSKYFPFSRQTWTQALEESVPEKFLELNKRAFDLGFSG